MFVRKNQNRSGSVSIQVVSKSRGSYRVIKSFGASKDPNKIERLLAQAHDFIHHPENQLSIFPYASDEDKAIDGFMDTLHNSQIRTIGPELILGSLFDKTGFGIIPEELFRHIVIARLAYPTSKLKTCDYLYRYRGIQVSVDAVYRFLDELHNSYKDNVERIAYEYSKSRLGGSISVVFYDMTTLYFEAEDEDDLRKIGFSKDGKFQHPQIMLGLLVGKGGYPIGYDIFKGNTFEGHTLLPTLDKIEKKYGFKKPSVIADAALLSKKNLNNLGEAKYRFIVGGRIKNESENVQKKILNWANNLQDGNHTVIKKDDGTRLIVTYSDKRAKKDVHNRERGLSKLKKRVKAGRLTKEHINNRGYNKFLNLLVKLILQSMRKK